MLNINVKILITSMFVVLFLVATLSFTNTLRNEYLYRQHVVQWMQQVQDSSTRLHTAVTPVSIDRIAVREELATIIALETNAATVTPPARYKPAHEQLLSALHLYRSALHAMNDNDLLRGALYLDLAGRAFEITKKSFDSVIQ